MDETLMRTHERFNAAYTEAGLAYLRTYEPRSVWIGDDFKVYRVQDITPLPGLHLGEFIGEIFFPHDFDELYLSLQPRDKVNLTEVGLCYNHHSRPEAVMNLSYGTVEEHFSTLSSIKPLVKLLPRLKVTRNTWTYDEEMEHENVRHFIRAEGLDASTAENYCDRSFYAGLAGCVSKLDHMWRDDYWLDGVFVGHSLWSEHAGELYWITPVPSRTEKHRKLRIGNLMMLHAMQVGYARGITRINFGVDDFPYKREFWHTNRIMKPGLEPYPS